MVDRDQDKRGSKETRAAAEIEFEPDAWERFKSAVHRVAKAGPKPKKQGKSKRA